ncbi:MAG TPA: hypothetical protein VNZ45_10010, partial [Bacteroidia bacterium]|nr:hypothetical protein [Bacteroidia bacterium]
AQSADDVVNKCLDALGGKEKLSSINNIYEEGSTDANGTTIHIKIWIINKKESRGQNEFNGMTTYTIITNDSGWSFNPRRGQKQAEPLTHDVVRRAQFGLDIQSPLLNYKDKGYTINFLGKDDEVDGSDTYKLELKVSDSLIVTYYIDPDSYFIMRIKTKTIANGRTTTRSNDYSDYQKNAEGYTFPMEIGSGRGQTKYTLIKVNTDIDPSLFRPWK